MSDAIDNIKPEDIEFFAKDIGAEREQAAQLLFGMVQGSIADAQMPPRPIMEWFCAHMVTTFMETEFFVIHVEPNNKDAAAELQNGVNSIARLLGFAQTNKLIGLHGAMVQRLNTRKLRYPTHMDLTYNGMLP